MLLDFLFPRQSLSGTEGSWITEEELSRITSAPRLFRYDELRRQNVHALDRLFAASSYHHCPLLKKAIHIFKYQRIPAAGKMLCTILVNSTSLHFPMQSDACICPVPLHWSRKFQRGFNQAEILGLALAKQHDVTVCHLLRRIRPTGHQSHRGRKERLHTLLNAFRTSFSGEPPQHVYLVDDLFTTGATMEECARVLKDAGVKKVEGIVLAFG